MRDTEYRLAIDIGASGGRHILGKLCDGKLVTEEIYRFENGMIDRDGHKCWDIDALFSHVLEGLRRCAEAGHVPQSIGIDTWAVDFIPLDADDRPVGSAVAYRDSRTDGIPEAFDAVMPFEMLYRHTGIARQPFNTLYQLIALLRYAPETAQRVRDFLLIPEYLCFLLTGRKAHEWTNVSTTALADAKTRTWSEPVRKAAGLPEHWFMTPIAEPGTSLGGLKPEVIAKVGFDTEVILTATHDTGSAYLAVPAKDAHAAFLSSGTWSLLGAELPEPETSSASLNAGFTNEGGFGGTTRYLKNIMGMWILQCIRAETGKQYTYAEMAEMAARSDYAYHVDASDKRFLAPDSMLDAVHNALAEQGAPAPLSLGDTLRAVTYGLAVCYRDSIREMEQITGRHFTSINIVGGGCRNQTLNRMTAELTGLPVYAGPAEGTALGNLAVQMIAAGELADAAEARKAIAAGTEMEVFLP